MDTSISEADKRFTSAIQYVDPNTFGAEPISAHSHYAHALAKMRRYDTAALNITN